MKSCHFRPFDGAIDKEMVIDFLTESLRIGCDQPVNIEENSASYFAAVERAQTRYRRFCSMMLEGDEVIGFVDVFTMPKKLGSGFMRFCYVVPERRGCGVSDMMVDYSVELMSEYGCNEILLDVRADNKRAVGFYARYGWIVREEKQEGFLRMGRILKARNETKAGCEP